MSRSVLLSITLHYSQKSAQAIETAESLIILDQSTYSLLLQAVPHATPPLPPSHPLRYTSKPFATRTKGIFENECEQRISLRSYANFHWRQVSFHHSIPKKEKQLRAYDLFFSDTQYLFLWGFLSSLTTRRSCILAREESTCRVRTLCVFRYSIEQKTPSCITIPWCGEFEITRVVIVLFLCFPKWCDRP